MAIRAHACCWVVLTSAVATQAAAIRVSNPTDTDWKEIPVVVPWTAASSSAWEAGKKVLTADGRPVAYQLDDLNGDGKTDELACLLDIKAGQTVELKFTDQGTVPQPPRRAHALMSLKGYDGPGWESDLIAFRIYWNADNAMDLFGKTRPRLSLDGWATPGIPHNIENEYGLDVLKVARSVGIGGFGAWINGRIEKVSNVMKTHYIRADGPIRAMVELEYVFWQPGPIPDLSRIAITDKNTPKYDLNVFVSIFAGQKWGQADILVKPLGEAPMPEMVTGLPKHEETELIKDEKVGILGRWGNQALGNGETYKAGGLGLGVIVDPKTAVAYGEDDFTTYVRLKTDNGRISYRYLGSWFKEPAGAQSTAEYEKMLRDVAQRRAVVRIKD